MKQAVEHEEYAQAVGAPDIQKRSEGMQPIANHPASGLWKDELHAENCLLRSCVFKAIDLLNAIEAHKMNKDNQTAVRYRKAILALIDSVEEVMLIMKAGM